MRDSSGSRVADGNFVQWIAKDGLHVQITYTGGGKTMEETIVVQQRPELAQRAWGWREVKDGKPIRTFEMNFVSGAAIRCLRRAMFALIWSKY